MKDRNKGYVPDPTYEGGEVRPHYTTLVGNPYVEEYVKTEMPVALGAADELNRTDTWEWARVPGDTEHWSHFEGHHVRVAFWFRAWNEREVNDWKGRDEIRKAGTYEIAFNEQIVYGDYYSDPFEACLVIRDKIRKIQSLPMDWRQLDYEGQIVGRRIFYRDKPATITSWMPEQGCVWIEPLDPRQELDDYYGESGVKDTILSPHIWWWRDENQTERERA